MPMPPKKPNYAQIAKRHGGVTIPSTSKSDDTNTMPDYSDVPAFIKQGIDMGKVSQVVTPPHTDEDHISIAEVDTAEPYKIKVLSPDLYGPPIQNHELTHTFQSTRNKSLPQVSTNYSGKLSGYNYGGVQGLIEARKQGKTISDFNYEQQAEMVKDYKVYHDQYLKKAAAGKITPEEEKKMYALQQAYHPFIKQLANMPGIRENLNRSPLLELIGAQKPATINTRPEAPGLPSYETPGLGILPADPLMGGKSQSTIKRLVEEARKRDPKKNINTPSTQPKGGDQTLQQVIKEYPGLAKNFNANNTSIVFATGERARRGSKERGGLEFWHPEGEPVATGGDPTYPTPQLGKNVLEIYDNNLKNNPSALKAAITGDLLHGMNSDPYWKGLRDQFMQNFTPQELKRQNEAETWWEDVNGDRHAEQKGAIGHARGNGTYDAYIRGWLFNEGNGRKGQKEQGNTMYSTKQIQILQKMQEYLKTGKSQDKNKPTPNELLEEAKKRSPK